MSRMIEIRLKRQVDIRVEKGKRVEHLGPDPERIGAAIHPHLEQAVRDRYGEDVELRFTSATQPDIRLSGGYADKPGAIKAAIWTLLGEAMESLDADTLS